MKSAEQEMAGKLWAEWVRATLERPVNFLQLFCSIPRQVEFKIYDKFYLLIVEKLKIHISAYAAGIFPGWQSTS